MQDARLDEQDEKLAAQGAKAQQHEEQFRVLSRTLESFQETLEDIKTSMKDLQTQNSSLQVENPSKTDFIANLHTMITAMKTAQSNAQELERLRAENAAMKTKWDIVQSAIVAAGGSPSPHASITASQHTNLGKRKRDIDISESTATAPPAVDQRPRSWSLAHASSSTQVPTPESSNSSDDQSAGPAHSSRNTTPEETQVQSKSRESEVEFSARRIPQRANENSLLSSRARRSSAAVRFVLGNASGEPSHTPPGILNVQENDRQHSVPVIGKKPSQPVEQDASCRASRQNATEMLRDKLQPQADTEINEFAKDHQQQLGDDDGDDEAQMVVDNTEKNDIRVWSGESVEFSDDQQTRLSSSEGPAADFNLNADPAECHDDSIINFDHGELAQNPNASTLDEVPIQSAAARRTRSKTKEASTRRQTITVDLITDKQSIEPGPQSARRVLPRPIDHDQIGQFEHATPATVEKELEELKNPKKAPRKYKPRVPRSTKVLTQELKDLGLEEWIDKDENDPEYVRLVREARDRKREQSQPAVLASRDIGSEGLQPSTPNLEQAFQEAATALVDVSNEQDVRPKISAKTAGAARRASGTGERRKKKEQREAEIRRRDELARAAMEISD